MNSLFSGLGVGSEEGPQLSRSNGRASNLDLLSRRPRLSRPNGRGETHSNGRNGRNGRCNGRNGKMKISRFDFFDAPEGPWIEEKSHPAAAGLKMKFRPCAPRSGALR